MATDAEGRELVRWVLLGVMCLVGLMLLRWVLPPILQACGAAVGFVLAGALHGVVSGLMSGWLAVASLAGISAVGLSSGFLVTMKLVERAREKPFVPILVVLGVIQAFILDLAKEVAFETRIQALLFKMTVALALIFGVFYWKQAGWSFKAMSVVVCSIVVGLVFFMAIPDLRLGIRPALAKTSVGTWVALGGFCLVGLSMFLVPKTLLVENGSR